ncbi:MAG: type II toxin-antitoxin system VapC family toxin [Propionibacteriaceae bacterium]|jgi:predicted nucleic acid-binding protein|nr:type II toxin-antitoxin system VapC family toxin [Propionibacteriaceae bacterium]
MVAYYDTSALVKLAVAETESDALGIYWATHPNPTSSALARTELMRAVRAEPTEVKTNARAVLASLDLIGLDDSVLDTAASLDPHILRTLDAIHIAAALSLGSFLDELVTYDKRMTTAARRLGIAVASPHPGDLSA